MQQTFDPLQRRMPVLSVLPRVNLLSIELLHYVRSMGLLVLFGVVFIVCGSTAQALKPGQSSAVTPSIDLRHGALQVSANRRFLQHANGTPFFYLADTAWELFHRLDRAEAERYLENRRQKRFTVIQALALAELNGVNGPNAYGDKPLLNNNPATPD